MTHRESAPAAELSTGEGLTQTLTHGRHSRPKPLGGQLRLPAIKVSGAAMAMSTVVGISIATTWLITAQQRVGYGPRMSTVGATPTDGGIPGASTPPSQLAGGTAPAAGSASSTTPLSSGATVTARNDRTVKPGATPPAAGAAAGPTSAGGGASTSTTPGPGGQLADRAPVSAPASPPSGGIATGPAAGVPSTPVPGASTAADPAAAAASPTQSTQQPRPPYPAGLTPGTPGMTPGITPGMTPGLVGGPGHADEFHPGAGLPGSPTAPTTPTTSAPATPAVPAPQPAPGTSRYGTPAYPVPAPSLAGWGGTVASAGLGQRHTVTLTVTEPLAAMETELRLPRTDATAGAMTWSTLPGARVTLLQQGDTVVYRFAPPPGEDVLPGTYTFTVQGARSATPGVGDATGRWTASGFALRSPQAVAAHGGFAAAKP